MHGRLEKKPRTKRMPYPSRRWKVKEAVYAADDGGWPGWAAERGMDLKTLHAWGRANNMSMAELVDWINHTQRTPAYLAIFPLFDLPNEHLHLKTRLPAYLHKMVDDLNLDRTKEAIQRRETMLDYDFAYWNAMSERMTIARQRINLWLAYADAACNSIATADGLIHNPERPAQGLTGGAAEAMALLEAMHVAKAIKDWPEVDAIKRELGGRLFQYPTHTEWLWSAS